MEWSTEIEALADELQKLASWPTANTVIAQRRLCELVLAQLGDGPTSEALAQAVFYAVRRAIDRMAEPITFPMTRGVYVVTAAQAQEACRHLLRLHRNARTSATHRREDALIAMNLSIPVQAWRKEAEIELMRQLAAALVVTPEAKRAYSTVRVQVHADILRSGVIPTVEFVVTIRANREVSSVRWTSEYPTDPRPGVIRAEEIFGCEIESTVEPWEARSLSKLTLKLPTVSADSTYTFAWRFRNHTTIPAQPFLSYVGSESGAMVVYRLRFEHEPKAVERFQDVTYTAIPARRPPGSNLKPQPDGEYVAEFVAKAGLSVGVGWEM